MNKEIKDKLEKVKQSILVFDIETSALYPDTKKPINITTNFDDYVKFAKVKWIGMYSYKYDEYVEREIYGNEDLIKSYIEQHDILCGFNSEDFDFPIMENNDLIPDLRFKQIDVMRILGTDTFKGHKNRGALMGYKFKRNSLKVIAQTMNLETQKGDIDYKIFFKDSWTDEEILDIKMYLWADVKATKQMFDKLWNYWIPFTEFLTEEDILNLSWIKSSIASLTYKAACKVKNVEPTYGEKSEDTKEEMGGRVIEPKYEEATDVWYVDFTSLYPHIFAMFNLFSEVDKDVIEFYDDMDNIWHGNDLFKVKGYYDISKQDELSKDIIDKLKMRKQLKQTDPENPLQYAIKIFLNSLYGAARSPIFEQVHTKNCGWDCCWLGQQINKLAEDMMTEMGFETIAGDTDSIFVVINDKEKSNEKYVKECLSKVVKKILDNVPFPADTYNIDIEDYLYYVSWSFSEQPIEWDGDSDYLEGLLINKGYSLEDCRNIVDFNEQNTKIGHNVKGLNKRLIKIRKGKKKNYLYIYEKNGEKKVKIAGLPIKKDGATLLAPKIFKEVLEPQILDKQSAKFSREYIESLLEEYLNKPDGFSLLVREYKIKPFDSYKNASQIQAQISLGYFNGQDGVINLIKNKKCGRAGKTAKYCTVEEAIEHKLELKDLDLSKVRNELEPFVKNEVK